MESTDDSYSQNQIQHLEIFASSGSSLQMQHAWSHLGTEFSILQKKEKENASDTLKFEKFSSITFNNFTLPF